MRPNIMTTTSGSTTSSTSHAKRAAPLDPGSVVGTGVGGGGSGRVGGCGAPNVWEGWSIAPIIG